MILAFSTTFPDDKPGIAGQHTMFVEKIRNHTKIHTIRRDQHERWKPGMKIHFTMNHRTPDQFQFADVIPLDGKERIRIRWSDGRLMAVLINERFASFAEMEKLAENDGFDSLEEFFNWFNEDFDGWILHWTPFRYK